MRRLLSLRPLLFALVLPLLLSGASSSCAQEGAFSIEPVDGGLKVLRDGQLAAQYLAQSGSKPIIWPLIGPGGLEMTRGYPMREATAEERDDHPHHRSLWFSQDEVNGIDFWGEGEGHGRIVERSRAHTTNAHSAVIETRNEWVGPDGKVLLSDLRRFVFHGPADRPQVDCEFTLVASEGPVTFGDTKEGTFAIRVPGTMKVDAGKGGKVVNNHGQQDKDAWGKQARWVDYSGPVEGETVGITIMNHPSSFNFPCRWHVRTYGLFAANPFGVYHFEGGKPTEGVRLEPGESLRLRYRVLMHRGTAAENELEAAFDEYAKVK